MYSKLKIILIIIFINSSHPLSYDQASSKLELTGTPITIRDFMDDWNYFVRVECQNLCGGVLIHPRWVLTTAECINTARKCTVKMGTIYLDDINGDESIKIISSKTISHPFLQIENESGYKLHNIGLIQLSTRVRLSRKVNVVTIPGEVPKKTGTCVVLSWGGDVFPVSLYEVSLKDSTFKDCKELNELVQKRHVHNGSVCDFFGMSTSENDTGLSSLLHSGAALMCGHYFYGILNSTGFSFENNYYAVWNYLLGYMDWINEVLTEHGDRPIIVLGQKNWTQSNITYPHTMKAKPKTTTRKKLFLDNYQEVASNFERRYMDPFEMYMNQTGGKNKFRRYNPKFRKLNTLLRKQESDNDVTYEDYDEVETRNDYQIKNKKDKRAKEKRMKDRKKKKNRHYIETTEAYDDDDDDEEVETEEPEETTTTTTKETTENNEFTEDDDDQLRMTEVGPNMNADPASEGTCLKCFTNIFIVSFWFSLTMFFS